MVASPEGFLKNLRTPGGLQRWRAPGVGQDLGAALLAQWPSYAAYVVSFATIGIIWVNHHQLFVHVRRVDRTLLFLNLGLLMVVSLIPFPTAISGALRSSMASHTWPRPCSVGS
jgi:uncharacterized membrane protein